jgi:hypothetical protein
MPRRDPAREALGARRVSALGEPDHRLCLQPQPLPQPQAARQLQVSPQVQRSALAREQSQEDFSHKQLFSLVFSMVGLRFPWARRAGMY